MSSSCARPIVIDLCLEHMAVLTTPDEFWSVGGQDAECAQVSDKEVVDYLQSAERSLGEKQRGVCHHYGSGVRAET